MGGAERLAMIVMAVLVTAIHPRIKSGDRLAAGMLDDADARDKPTAVRFGFSGQGA
jgi:hypothetical protein